MQEKTLWLLHGKHRNIRLGKTRVCYTQELFRIFFQERPQSLEANSNVCTPTYFLFAFSYSWNVVQLKHQVQDPLAFEEDSPLDSMQVN